MKKRWMPLIIMMASFTATAQPLQLSAADVNAFSKAMMNAYSADKNGFRQYYTRMLGKNAPQFNLQQLLSQTGKNKQVLEDVLHATFLAAGNPGGHKKYLTTLQIPAQHLKPLSEYALYLLAKKDNEQRGHAPAGQKLFYGAKLFRDPENAWYYLLIVTGNDIEIRSYPAPGNSFHKDKSKPDEVLRGKVNGDQITVNGFSQGYIFMNGVLGTLNNEETYNEFFECTPAGKFVWGEPKSEFAELSIADFDENGRRRESITLVEITPSEELKEKNVFTFVEQPPTFPGGQDALTTFLSNNLRYPKAAADSAITGTIYVAFVIDAEGKTKNVKTVGPRKGGGLEEEAIRVVKAMPAWKPGKQDGKPVAVQFNLPLRFSLQR